MTPFRDRIRFRWLAFILLMATPAMFINADLRSNYAITNNKEYKAVVAKAVYERIARTVKDSRKAPTFNFIYSGKKPYYNAYYNPQNNTINFGEGVYDLATTFGKDSLNALAMVIGHELAHYYKDHGWGMSFGTANEDTEIAEKIYDLELNQDVRASMEAEADYFGGLYGYMAGYNTLKVGGAFFDKLYKAIGLPDSTSGYPTRADRIEICNNSRKMLQKLTHVYKAANMLTLTKQYEKAALCYDYIIATFPSREIYNNAGAAYLAAALQDYEEEELQFLYPIGLDLDTRMNQATTKGASEEAARISRRKRLLQQAKDQFEDAIRLDESYAPAYINLASTLSLLNEQEMALAYAGKGAKFAEAAAQPLQQANASIVRGIVFAQQGKKGDAKKAFQAAKTNNELLAQANLEALNNGVIAKLFRKKTKDEVVSLQETIGDVGIEVIEILFEEEDQLSISHIEKQNEDRPETIVASLEEEEFDAILVASYGGYMGAKETILGFLFAKEGYSGQTARGIKMGSSYQTLINKYGNPTQMIATVQGNFHFYEKSNLIIQTDKDNIVAGWLIFGQVK